MTLVGIFGTMGCGKTLSMTYYAYKFYRQGCKIYSNYNLNFPHIKVEKPEDIEDMRNGVFVGDELWSWADARTSMAKRNKFVSKILLKSRKRNINMFYTAQHFMQMDIRIRRVTDYVIFPSFRGNRLKVQLNRKEGETITPLKAIVLPAPPLYQLYDTEEEIYEPED